MPVTYDLIRKDIDVRQEHGVKKYGQAHQAFNGRNQLIDAYQENLDFLVYLRAEIEERRFSPCLTKEDLSTVMSLVWMKMEELNQPDCENCDAAKMRVLHAKLKAKMQQGIEDEQNGL